MPPLVMMDGLEGAHSREDKGGSADPSHVLTLWVAPAVQGRCGLVRAGGRALFHSSQAASLSQIHVRSVPPVDPAQ